MTLPLLTHSRSKYCGFSAQGHRTESFLCEVYTPLQVVFISREVK